MVRFAELSDIPAVCEIRRQVHKLHTDGRPDIYRMPEYTQQFDRLLYDAFSQDDYQLLVCEEEDAEAIAGYALLRLVLTKGSCIKQDRFYYFIEEFGVAEEQRGLGYGTALMNAIAEEARSHHAAALELDVWGFNESAEQFYRNFGMTAKHTFLELPLK